MKNIEEVDFGKPITLKGVWRHLRAEKALPATAVQIIPKRPHQGRIVTGWFVMLRCRVWTPVRVWLMDRAPDGSRSSDYWALLIHDEAMRVADGREAARIWSLDRAVRDLVVALNLPENPVAQEMGEKARRFIARVGINLPPLVYTMLGLPRVRKSK
jgi:hypothetical protein